MTKIDVEKFLYELTELTIKYRIGIMACGCCDSPWLYEKEVDDGWHYQVAIGIDGSGFKRLGLAPPSDPFIEEK